MCKEKCVICGSVRKRKLMVRTSNGVAHSYHRGVAAEEKYGKPTAQPLTNAAQNAQSGTSGDPAAAGA